MSKSFFLNEPQITVELFCKKHQIDIQLYNTGRFRKGKLQYQVLFIRDGTIYTHVFYENRPFSLYDFLWSIGKEYMDMQTNRKKKMKAIFDQVFSRGARYDLINFVAPNRVWQFSSAQSPSHDTLGSH